MKNLIAISAVALTAASASAAVVATNNNATWLTGFQNLYTSGGFFVDTFNNYMEPENAAAVTNYAAYTAGVTGVEAFLDDAIKNSPENNPPADAPAGSFIQVCDQETQQFYDAIWTNLKK